LIRILRSTAFRIASAFALAVTATTYFVFALVYWQFYTANVAVVREVLQDEIAKTEGAPIAQLKRQLELRLTQDLRHLDYVGLYDSSGKLSFGNVAATLSIPFDGKAHAVKVPPPQQEAWESENAIFVARKRADGSAILLGRSLVYVDQLESAMLRAFNAAIVPVIVLALVIGTIVSLRASRRLTSIQDAINRVMGGELSVRLPARGTPDDIDELVRAVNLMLDEIGRLVAQIKSVGDNIAHDLRAPLAVMRARLERGLAGSSEDTLRRLTIEALGDLERAMTTVTALLRISELETGMRRSAFDSVDLALVCADAFDLYQPLGEAKGIAMDLDASARTVVTGDGDLLREALANLIDNAIKFTPAGGRVRVACGTPDALIVVEDNGPGIAADEREKIVKRFYRSKSTASTPGVGLGLSMATTIVELHGFGLRIGDAGPGALFEIVRADPLDSASPIGTR
jgi:signal transduction histidine kinase